MKQWNYWFFIQEMVDERNCQSLKFDSAAAVEVSFGVEAGSVEEGSLSDAENSSSSSSSSSGSTTATAYFLLTSTKSSDLATVLLKLAAGLARAGPWAAFLQLLEIKDSCARSFQTCACLRFAADQDGAYMNINRHAPRFLCVGSLGLLTAASVLSIVSAVGPSVSVCKARSRPVAL